MQIVIESFHNNIYVDMIINVKEWVTHTHTFIIIYIYYFGGWRFGLLRKIWND